MAFFIWLLYNFKILVIFKKFRMEFHMSELKKACRVCGRRLRKAKKERDRSYVCKEHSKDLAEVFQIDIGSDSEDTHPLLFCLSCFTVIAKRISTGGRNVPPVGRLFQWNKHDGSECRVCIGLPNNIDGR